MMCLFFIITIKASGATSVWEEFEMLLYFS